MSLVIYQKPPSVIFHQYLNQIRARVIQNSLALQFVEYSFFRRFTLGTTIALIGAPCVGKSTLLQKIIKMRSNFVEETGENAVFNYGYTFLEDNYQKWGVSKEHWHHLLWTMRQSIDKWLVIAALYDTEGTDHLMDQFLHITEEDKKLAKETLNTLRTSFFRIIQTFPNPSEIDTLIKSVFDRSLSGKNTIFESGVEIGTNPRSKHVHKVFIYCPLSEYVERIDESVRTSIAEGSHLNDLTIGMFPLFRYASFIRAKEPADEESDVIDEISPLGVLHGFQRHFDNCLAILNQYAANKISEFKKYKIIQKIRVLKAFGFDVTTPWHNVVKLVPRDHYDEVIHTEGFDESVSIDLRATHAAKTILRRMLEPSIHRAEESKDDSL